MTGGILALAIVGPIAGVVALYRCLTHGKYPCVDMSSIDNHNQVLPEK
jgi:hypothetical protein